MIKEATHVDIMVVLAIILAVALFGLGFIAWMVRDVSRIARAVGALVIQETGKLRRS